MAMNVLPASVSGERRVVRLMRRTRARSSSAAMRRLSFDVCKPNAFAAPYRAESTTLAKKIEVVEVFGGGHTGHAWIVLFRTKIILFLDLPKGSLHGYSRMEESLGQLARSAAMSNQRRQFWDSPLAQWQSQRPPGWRLHKVILAEKGGRRGRRNQSYRGFPALLNRRNASLS